MDGDSNVRALMQFVIRHYTAGKQTGLFPDSTTSVVLAAVYNDETALPDQINIINANLARLGLPITSRQYRVLGPDDDRMDGETSLIIHCQEDTDPDVYVNDQLLTQDTESQEIAQDDESDESERHIQNTVAAFDHLRRRGLSGEQATQQIIGRLCQHGRTPSVATNRVQTLLALGRLRSQGTTLADAITQVVARLVQLGMSDEDARARVRAAFHPTLR